MDANLLVVSLFAAGIELMVAAGLEAGLVVALGRRPTSRLARAYLRDLRRPRLMPRVQATGLAALLALLQILPLLREGLLGGPRSPDHISGVGVIIAEVLFGAWLWLGTTSEPPERAD